MDRRRDGERTEWEKYIKGYEKQTYKMKEK
jgi:hypothetical protein